MVRPRLPSPSRALYVAGVTIEALDAVLADGSRDQDVESTVLVVVERTVEGSACSLASLGSGFAKVYLNLVVDDREQVELSVDSLVGPLDDVEL